MFYRFIFLLFVIFNVHAKEQFSIPQSLLNQVEQGNSEAAYFIADTFYNGSDDYEKDKIKALFWFEKAAKMDNPHAMLALADELDGEDKKLQAFSWYEKAAELGMGKAMDMIASYYYYGYAGLSQDCQIAYQWYEKAETKQIKTAFNNHAWLMATATNSNCRNPERALKIIFELFAIYTDEDTIPWNVWDTKAAVLAAVSDFGAAIKLQKWLIEELTPFDIDIKNYQIHLGSYLQRKAWVEK